VNMLRSSVLLLMCQLAVAPQAEPEFLSGQITYPLLAQRARQEGDVIVEITSDSEGKVTEFRPISAHPLFGRFAETQSATWRFSGKGKVTLYVSYRRVSKGTQPLQESVVRDGPNRLTVLLVYPEYFPAHGQHPTKCTRHGCNLERDLVPVVYGLVLPRRGPIFKRLLVFLHLTEPDDYLEACKRVFPFAYSVAFGGCIIQEYPKEEVFYCRLCREREVRWKRDHRWPAGK